MAQGPYLLGERFTATDVLWACALTRIVAFKLVPELPEIMSYLGCINARPAAMRRGDGYGVGGSASLTLRQDASAQYASGSNSTSFKSPRTAA